MTTGTVYVSTDCVQGAGSVLEALELLQSAGIEDVELSGPHGYLPGLTSHIEQRPLNYVIHNYFPSPEVPFVINLASGDPDVRQRSIDHATGSLRLCERIGSRLYTIHGGFRADPDTSFRFRPDALALSRNDALDRFSSTVGSLCEVAGECGVTLGIENNVLDERNYALSPDDPLLLFLGAQDYRDLFSAVGSRALGVHLDVGHLNVTCKTLGWERDIVIGELAPWACSLHLHDNDGVTDGHGPVSEASWFIEPLARHAGDTTWILEAHRLAVGEIIAQRSLLRRLRSPEDVRSPT